MKNIDRTKNENQKTYRVDSFQSLSVSSLIGIQNKNTINQSKVSFKMRQIRCWIERDLLKSCIKISGRTLTEKEFKNVRIERSVRLTHKIIIYVLWILYLQRKKYKQVSVSDLFSILNFVWLEGIELSIFSHIPYPQTLQQMERYYVLPTTNFTSNEKNIGSKFQQDETVPLLCRHTFHYRILCIVKIGLFI